MSLITLQCLLVNICIFKWDFWKGRKEKLHHKAGQRNRVLKKSHSMSLLCWVAVMCYSWKLFFCWEEFGLRTQKPVHHCNHVGGGQASAFHLSTAVAVSQDVAPFLLKLENTNGKLHHLHRLCPHLVLGKQRKQNRCQVMLYFGYG